MYSLLGIIAAMEISSPLPCSESIGRKLLSSSIVFCSSFTVLSLRLKIKPGNLLVSNESVKPYKQLQEELFRIGTELFLLVMEDSFLGFHTIPIPQKLMDSH